MCVLIVASTYNIVIYCMYMSACLLHNMAQNHEDQWWLFLCMHCNMHMYLRSCKLHNIPYSGLFLKENFLQINMLATPELLHMVTAELIIAINSSQLVKSLPLFNMQVEQ